MAKVKIKSDYCHTVCGQALSCFHKCLCQQASSNKSIQTSLNKQKKKLKSPSLNAIVDLNQDKHMKN